MALVPALQFSFYYVFIVGLVNDCVSYFFLFVSSDIQLEKASDGTLHDCNDILSQHNDANRRPQFHQMS
ncbi:hypothetical protein ACSBR2_040150 [Camellia fascicularis]